MSPATRTKKTNKKISTNPIISTLITQTTDSDTTAENTDSATCSHTDNNTMSNTNTTTSLPEHFAAYLRGMGLHAHKDGGFNPKFKGNRDQYHIFELKLRNYISLHELESFLDSDEKDDVKNLYLYHLIVQCLDDDPLQLVACQAKNDGRKAYKLLGEKYLGNFNARKICALNELALLKQGKNETISTYISRVDLLIQKLKQFGVFNDTSFYVIKTLQGLDDKYDTFKTVITSTSEIPEWDDFKVRIQNHDQLSKPTADKQNTAIMQITTSNAPQINKKKKQNTKRFTSKPKEKCSYCFSSDHISSNCNSRKYCKYCNNWSHHTDECKNIKSQISYRGRGRSSRGGRVYRGFRGARGHYSGYRGAAPPRGGAYPRSNRGNHQASRGRGIPGNNYDQQYYNDYQAASNYVNPNNDDNSMFA